MRKILLALIIFLTFVSCKTNEIVSRTSVKVNGEVTYLYEVIDGVQLKVFFDTTNYKLGSTVKYKNDSIIEIKQ